MPFSSSSADLHLVVEALGDELAGMTNSSCRIFEILPPVMKTGARWSSMNSKLWLVASARCRRAKGLPH